MSGLRKRTLTVVVIAIGVLGMSTAVVYAGARGDHGPSSQAKQPSHHGHGRHARASRRP